LISSRNFTRDEEDPFGVRVSGFDIACEPAAAPGERIYFESRPISPRSRDLLNLLAARQVGASRSGIV
jgi:hypothetical protein